MSAPAQGGPVNSGATVLIPDGSFVISAAAVRRLGPDFLAQLNNASARDDEPT